MHRLRGVAAGVVVFWAASVASAGTDPACAQAAAAQKKACKIQCMDEFQTSKFQCRGVDPTCGNPCLAGKIACVNTVTASRESCIADCDAQLQVDKATCSPAPPCKGDPTCDACVDAFQVQAFVCRDDCREAFNADPSTRAQLALCQSTFQACIKACK